MKQVPGTWEHGEPPAPQQIPRSEAGPVLRDLEAEGALYVRLYRMGECAIVVSREPCGPGGSYAWHLSISHLDRHPSWDEIKAARYWLLPDALMFAMLLPPSEEYFNLPAQDHVFHMYEIPDPEMS